MNLAAGSDAMTALVLCGGSSRGALEVGFYRAIRELGVRIDLVVGSSIGALNGAYIAAGTPPDELARLWREFDWKHAARLNLRWLLGPGRSPGLFTLDPLRVRLRRTLRATRFEELALPLHVAATDLQLGKAVYWHGRGDLIEPVLASMSLPVVFPPVTIGEHQYVDGGIANNVPLDRAFALGARDVFLIECVCCEAADRPVGGMMSVLARSLTVAMDARYEADVARFAGAARLHVVKPVVRRDIGLLDFRYTEELIEAGYRQTLEQLRGAAVLAAAA